MFLKDVQVKFIYGVCVNDDFTKLSLESIAMNICERLSLVGHEGERGRERGEKKGGRERGRERAREGEIEGETESE